jgi:ankyrin repeat protein
MLLEKNASVDLQDSYGMTSINLAARKNHTDIVSLLLAKSANPNTGDEDGYTPLHYAVSNNSVTVVKLLLENGAFVDPEDRSRQTPLYFVAAQEGYREIVSLLLAKSADPNIADEDDQTPLLWAAGNGHADVVEMLCSRKSADPNRADKNGQTPLLWAARNGHADVIPALLNEGASVNLKVGGKTVLQLAAEMGFCRAVVEKLLAGGAEPNIPDRNGNTPLHHLAANNHHKDLVPALLDKGADPSLLNNEGQSAFSIAQLQNNGEVVGLFENHLNNIKVQVEGVLPTNDVAQITLQYLFQEGFFGSSRGKKRPNDSNDKDDINQPTKKPKQDCEKVAAAAAAAAEEDSVGLGAAAK